ncbi:TPA: response regulator transcription factor [Streptococcus agalactiae]
MKILVVEDEFDLNRSIVKLLKKQHYSVDSASNGEEALQFVSVAEYDVIILDVMMPKMDGFTFLKLLRNKGSQVSILMLTARDAVEDRIAGLDFGADDYLVKPFEFGELMARIRAMLRRTNRQVSSDDIQIQDITINLSTKQVWRNNNLIDLTAKEYEVLSRHQIREHVWDYDYDGESNIIDVLIKNLRRKLDNNRDGSLIKTKRGLGYVIPK